MASSLIAPLAALPDATAARTEAIDFEAVYAQHFDFVWRSVRRLGVGDGAAEDVAQEVFVIVMRRLHTYERRASLRAWLFGIVRGVVANHRRGVQRQRLRGGHDGDSAADPRTHEHPHERVEKAEAVRILQAIVDELDEDQREVFVLAEIEQMPMPEIAEALAVNTNTAYSRLRAARAQFKQIAARYRAQDGWKLR